MDGEKLRIPMRSRAGISIARRTYRESRPRCVPSYEYTSLNLQGEIERRRYSVECVRERGEREVQSQRRHHYKGKSRESYLSEMSTWASSIMSVSKYRAVAFRISLIVLSNIMCRSSRLARNNPWSRRARRTFLISFAPLVCALMQSPPVTVERIK